MKFLYKIYSRYDGFTPKHIPERMQPSNKLVLGWTRYIEDVRKDDEVWVFFHGPGSFRTGVYIKGVVTAVHLPAFNVTICAREFSTDVPITDDETSKRVAEAVSTRFQQVFLFPEAWTVAPKCNINATASSCSHRHCENCETWQGLHRIEPRTFWYPTYIRKACKRKDCQDFVAAYWVVPPRSVYLGQIGPQVQRTSELFYRFKTGQQNLAFPLALGMFHVLRQHGQVQFDCLIPIPLSPDKVQAGEIHRTRLLAQELGRLLNCPVKELLTLKEAVSKRKMLSAGYTPAAFEVRYLRALQVADEINNYERVLVVDDVCTSGRTLKCAIWRIVGENNRCKLFAVTAGLMVVGPLVRVPAAISV